MPRFVILEHDHPELHWDLMLETGEVLRTWRLSSPPEKGKVIAATYLAEHRRMYLDYEGPVSGNRGHVVRWDSGVYSWLEDKSDTISIELEGTRFAGPIQLTRTQRQSWTMACR